MDGVASDLVLEGVGKTYEDGTVVLRDVSMAVRAGETVSIVGPSGSGKSTLLNLIGSLDQPTAGTVRLGEIDVGALSGSALAEFRSRTVGFIFQDHHLLPQLTAIENVLVPTIATRATKVEGRARGLLERVGLSAQANSFPGQMSGGERQRVAIARALVNEPRLLLCDEPTGNLDPETGGRAVDLFLEMARESGVTVVMVTHNASFAARFSRRATIRGGALTEEGDTRGSSKQEEKA